MEVVAVAYASAYASALPPDNGRLKCSTSQQAAQHCVGDSAGSMLLHCSAAQQAVQHCVRYLLHCASDRSVLVTARRSITQKLRATIAMEDDSKHNEKRNAKDNERDKRTYIYLYYTRVYLYRHIHTHRHIHIHRTDCAYAYTYIYIYVY